MLSHLHESDERGREEREKGTERERKRNQDSYMRKFLAATIHDPPQYAPLQPVRCPLFLRACERPSTAQIAKRSVAPSKEHARSHARNPTRTSGPDSHRTQLMIMRPETRLGSLQAHHRGRVPAAA